MAFALAIAMAGAATIVAVTQEWFKLKQPGGTARVEENHTTATGVDASEEKQHP